MRVPHDMQTGLVYENPSGKIRIDSYEGRSKVLITFINTGHQRYTQARSIRKGSQIRDPLRPSVVGVGYLGVGKFRMSKGKKHTKAYLKWRNMLIRCFSEEYQERKPTYVGCTVCDSWRNFQNFAQWCEDNSIKFKGEVHLDKDILKRGNKKYSPETCCLIPAEINIALTKNDAKRGDCLLGVTTTRRGMKFQARCSHGKGDSKYLGRFKTETEAFLAYKYFKEMYLRSLAVKYIEILPQKVYSALLNYKVLWTD